MNVRLCGLLASWLCYCVVLVVIYSELNLLTVLCRLQQDSGCLVQAQFIMASRVFLFYTI